MLSRLKLTVLMSSALLILSCGVGCVDPKTTASNKSVSANNSTSNNRATEAMPGSNRTSAANADRGTNRTGQVTRPDRGQSPPNNARRGNPTRTRNTGSLNRTPDRSDAGGARGGLSGLSPDRNSANRGTGRNRKPKLPDPAEETGETGTNRGDTIPEITGKDVDGEKFSLSDYEGKVVMLDFWGDW